MGKKGTALTYKFDLDLVLFMNDFNASQMSIYMDKCRESLKGAFGVEVKFTPKEDTPYCLRLEFAGQDVDLLITGDPANNRYDNVDRYYQAARSQQLDDEILGALKQHPMLLDLILVAKHWRNLYPSGRLCPSYYIELL